MRLLDRPLTERRASPEVGRRVRSMMPLMWASAGAFILLGLVAAQSAVPMEVLLLDPNAVAGQPWYAGLVTSLGILGWAAAVLGCGFTAFVAGLAGRRAAMVAFRGASLFFLLLLLDDLFLLHSDLVPSATGLPKALVLLAELILACLWLVPALPELRRTRWEILLVAGFWFGISLTTDSLLEPGGAADFQWRLLLEDGAKFLGAISLALWALLTATDVIRSVVVQAPSPAQSQG